jgi:large subunit ribosomal protein L24
MRKIQTGDKVKVMMGKDKGKEGVVEKVLPSKNTVLLPEINVYKKHVKGVQDKKGGIYAVARPLNVSKVMLICPNCKKPTRVGIKLSKDDKNRFCKKCGKTIDLKKVKKK